MSGSVWIRRCSGCGADDLDAIGGQAVLLDSDGWRWRCAICGGGSWEAVGMWMPDAPAVDEVPCPFLSGLRS